MPKATCLPLALAIALCGCGDMATNEARPANVIESAANAAASDAANVTNTVGAAGALSAYVGKYPRDAVAGTSFIASPQVRAAVEAVVPDEAVRSWVLRENTTQTPIVLRDGRLLSQACEPHNCGDHNWSILIDSAGTTAEVCYHEASMADQSRWYAAGRAPEMRPGNCPSE